MFLSIYRFALPSLLGLTAAVILPAVAQQDSVKIEDGSQVSITYTLTVEGEVVQSNDGQDPVVYTQGGGQILPALEAELVGMTAGQSKTVNLDAAHGYGEVDEAAFQEVPLEQIPEPAREVGTMLQAEGHPGPIRVAEIREDLVVLDFNHPLAGKDLTFDVVVVSVQDATQ